MLRNAIDSHNHGRAIIFLHCGFSHLLSFLWPPYGIGQATIFLPCDFYLSIFFLCSLWNRADHYIFILWFLSIYLLSFFFSSPNLSGGTLDVYQTSTSFWTPVFTGRAHAPANAVVQNDTGVHGPWTPVSFGHPFSRGVGTACGHG